MYSSPKPEVKCPVHGNSGAFCTKFLCDCGVNDSVLHNDRTHFGHQTWRDSEDGGKSYTIKPPIHFDEWRKVLGNEYVVLFRAHHQTTKVLGLVYDDFIRDASTYPAVNDLMIAADLLITDYSAIAFDFSILCKPILCYTYDYEDYLVKRGTYPQPTQNP